MSLENIRGIIGRGWRTRIDDGQGRTSISKEMGKSLTLLGLGLGCSLHRPQPLLTLAATSRAPAYSRHLGTFSLDHSPELKQ
jgi:hypothetical protein